MTPYCPTCDALTDSHQGCCAVCETRRPTEGWPLDPLIGRLFLNAYTVIRRLGSGGFGVVYLAENREFGGRRAIKVLDRRFVHKDTVLRRFKREAKALYQLQSPYTVRVERWGRTDEGHYYLVMELAEGETLRQLLDREHRLDEVRALSIARQTAVALSDANALGILHRDLKPDNLVVRQHPHEGDRVAVLDFGISKIISDESKSFRSGLVGTPAYMAPECWNPSLGPQDIRADLWSLGVVLFEMLTGRLPYQDEDVTPDAMTTAFKVAHLEPDHVLAGLDEVDVHTETRRIVLRLLRRRPADRYESPDEVLHDIEAHPLRQRNGPLSVGEVGDRREQALATAETVDLEGHVRPEVSSTAPTRDVRGRPQDPLGDWDSLGVGDDGEPDLLSFHDDPPEALGMSLSTDVEGGRPERGRGPSLGIILLALALLGALAVGVQYGDDLLALVDRPPHGAGVDGGTTTHDPLADVGDSEPLAAPVRSGRDGMSGALIPGGAATIGSDAPASLSPAHEVILAPFYLDEREVTAGAWLDCVQTGRCQREQVDSASEREGCRQLDGSADDSSQPLTCISWSGAEDYCEAYGRRLPTEAEWEHAARTMEDGSIAESSAGEGEPEEATILDLSESPSEWTSDWYSADYYDVSPTYQPTGSIFGTHKVYRGGADADDLDGLAARQHASPESRRPDLGFRCAESGR